MASNRKVMILPGDGIGVEVMSANLQLVDWLAKHKSLTFDISEDQVGGAAYDNTDATSSGTANALSNAEAHNTEILHDLGLLSSDGWQQYDDTPQNEWVSVFGTSNGMAAGTKGVDNCSECSDEWLPLFGDEVLSSRFQDGHYAYTVVAGGGSGNDVFPPVLYVVDVENAVDFNSVLEP